MVHCAALYCKNNSSRPSGKQITFHKFPSSEHLRGEWVKFVSRLNWVPSHSARLCSHHFKDKDFLQNKANRILCKGAIPSIPAARDLCKGLNQRKVPYACRIPTHNDLKKIAEEIKIKMPDNLFPEADINYRKIFRSPKDIVVRSGGRLVIRPPTINYKSVIWPTKSSYVSDQTRQAKQCQSTSDEGKSGEETMQNNNKNESQMDVQDEESVSSVSSPENPVRAESPKPVLFTQSDIKKDLERKLKLTERRYSRERKNVFDLRKKLKYYQQCTRRLKVKLEVKERAVNKAKQDAKDIMQDKMTMLDRLGFTKHLIQRQLEQLDKKDDVFKREYPEDLRSFCLDLMDINAGAYNYVREKFNCCLPDAHTVRRWKRNILINQNAGTLKLDNPHVNCTCIKVMPPMRGMQMLCTKPPPPPPFNQARMDGPMSLEERKTLLPLAISNILKSRLEKIQPTNLKIPFDNKPIKNMNNYPSSYNMNPNLNGVKNQFPGVKVESGSIVKDSKDGKYRIEITNDRATEVYEVSQLPQRPALYSGMLYPEDHIGPSEAMIDLLDHCYS